MNRISSLLSIVFLSAFFILSCGTSNKALNPNVPHTYLNSYQQVMDAVNKSLTQAGMKVFKTDDSKKNTYQVTYYGEKRYDMGGGSPNPSSTLMAHMTIKKIGDNKTKVTIKEEDQSNMVPGEYKQKLGRDVLRELNKLLTHETEQQTE